MKPVIAIDIDGTLGDHFEWTARFAEMWTGRDIKYDPQPVESPAAGNLLICCSCPRSDVILDL